MKCINPLKSGAVWQHVMRYQEITGRRSAFRFHTAKNLYRKVVGERLNELRRSAAATAQNCSAHLDAIGHDGGKFSRGHGVVRDFVRPDYRDAGIGLAAQRPLHAAA